VKNIKKNIKRIFSLPVTQELWIVLYAILSLGWLPTTMGGMAKNWIDFTFMSLLYVFIIFIAYIGILLVAHKIKLRASFMLKCFCCIGLLIVSGTMIYLYAFKIIASKTSLLITIPASVAILLLCVAITVKICKKHD
jgi:hypothetical protein